jgi:endonuclease IV
MDETNFGPDFADFAKVIAEFKLKPVIISESPIIDMDAMTMRDILEKELKS